MAWSWIVAAMAAAAVAVAAVTRPECPVEKCHYTGSTITEHLYKIDGINETVLWEWSGVEYAKLRCASPLAADDPSLPAFNTPLAPRRVTLVHCLPPASWGAALAKLGLQPPPRRLDLLDLTALTPAPATAWSRLDVVQELRLRAAAGSDAVELSPAAPLPPELQELRTEGVRVAWSALPGSLRRVTLLYAGLRELGGVGEALERVQVQEGGRLSARGLRGAGVRVLRLRGTPLDAMWEKRDALPRLENVTLEGVSGTAVSVAGDAWGGSAVLGEVRVQGRRDTRELPARWLAGCVKLHTLQLSGLGLVALPDTLLEGCEALHTLDVRNCTLRTLSDTLLRDTRELHTLLLDDNLLTHLPESVGRLSSLQKVSARRNLLTSLSAAWGAGAGGVAVSGGGRGLRTLLLDYNPLGDLCSDSLTSSSPLRSLWSLRELSLVATAATRLCADWRLQLVSLHTLRLNNNNITLLLREDLTWFRSRAAAGDEGGPGGQEWQGAGGAVVYLSNNPLTELPYYGDHDADNSSLAVADENRTPVTLDLSGCPLQCDCRVYWVARALRGEGGQLPVRVRGARCQGGTTLRDLQLDTLECVTSHCPERCTCVARPSEAPSVRATCDQVTPALQAWSSPLRAVRMEGRNVTRVPRLRASTRELLLSNNNIQTVTPEDLHNDTLMLDLRNNSLSTLSESAGVALVGGGRTLLVGGNPWRCACDDYTLLHMLHTHSLQVSDWKSVRCADGRWMRSVSVSRAVLCGWEGEGGVRSAAAVVGGTLLLLAVVVAALLYRYRHHLKFYLRSRGYCGCVSRGTAGAGQGKGQEEEQGQYTYDVFVSYSHHDAEWVEATLVSLLEHTLGLRACLHYREWTAGGWIPAQIARSVRSSSRTLAVVSRSSLAAQWPRAEVEAALQAAPHRLVVLLVEPPPLLLSAAAALHPALALHLTRATYLCRGDPRLAARLRDAIPHVADPATAAA